MEMNFNGVDLVFECREIEFEWEEFGLEYFHIYPSLSTHAHVYVCVCVCERLNEDKNLWREGGESNDPSYNNSQST